jgi:hypothetical protein
LNGVTQVEFGGRDWMRKSDCQWVVFIICLLLFKGLTASSGPIQWCPLDLQMGRQPSSPSSMT